MSYLMNLTDIEKSYGIELLFSEFSMGIEETDKIGVIGPNGAGKSTLLKIIAGITNPDSGDINRVKGLNCVYLDQAPEFDESATAGSVIFDALEKSLDINFDREGKIRKIIGLSGFSEYDERLISTFSGGMKKKLALACAMMKLPDILLLDEPTNHLDLEGIEWLENILKNSDFAFIAVTHDRQFLNNTARKIIEVSPVYPGSYLIVEGDYDRFLRDKTQFLENQSERVQTLRNKMRREDDWLSRSPKARTTKARYRIDSAEELRSELTETKRRDNVNLSPEIEFEATGRKTKRLISVEKVSKAYEGKNIFSEFSMVLKRNDRLSIVGPNGSGKTTLIDIFSKNLEPDKGKVFHVENLKILYFDQKRAFLDKTKTPKDILAPESDSVVLKNRKVHIISWLKKFGIDKDQINQPVHSLSGGEQARIMMADLVRTPCDIIFLDEPTNDLDIPTIEMLEESLMNFEGCVVAVTHDRYFAKSLGSQFVCLGGDGDIGIYSDLSQWKKDSAVSNIKKEKKPVKETAPDSDKNAAQPKKLSYKYQFELDHMEETILEAEEAVAEFESKICDPEIIQNQDEYAKICEELKNAQEKAEKLYERWEYLESLKDNL